MFFIISAKEDSDDSEMMTPLKKLIRCKESCEKSDPVHDDEKPTKPVVAHSDDKLSKPVVENDTKNTQDKEEIEDTEGKSAENEKMEEPMKVEKELESHMDKIEDTSDDKGESTSTVDNTEKTESAQVQEKQQESVMTRNATPTQEAS